MTRNKLLIFGVLLTILVAALYSVDRIENAFHAKYTSIQVGMTRTEVEAILGPGEEIEQKSVPSHVVPINPADEIAASEQAKKAGTIPTARNYPVRHKPIVEGDRILRWDQGSRAERIFISFIDGRVAEKDFEDLNYL